MAKTATEPTAVNECRCGCAESVNPNRLFRQGHDQRLISKLAVDVVEGDGTGLGLIAKRRAKEDIKVRIDAVAEKLGDKTSQALADKFVRAAERRWALLETRAAKQQARTASQKGRNGEAKPKRARKTKATAEAQARTAAIVAASSDPVSEAPTADTAPPTETAHELAEVETPALATPVAPDPADPFVGAEDVANEGRRAQATEVAPDTEPAQAAAPTKVAKRRPGPVGSATVGLGAPIKIKVRSREYDGTVAAMNQAGKVTVATYRTGSGAERRVENPLVIYPEGVSVRS